MTFQTALYFGSILMTFFLTGFLAWFAWRQTHVTGARSYAYMVLAESLLALTEVGSLLAGTEAHALFWFSLRVPFTAVIPVFWLFFALDYSGRGDWLSKPMRAALFAIPIITQVVMVTGSLHGLWLAQDVAFEKIGPFWIADTSVRIPGIWYLVHTFYSTLLLVVGAGVLVVAAWRKPKILLGQALLVSLGALTALGLALVGVFNLLPDLPFNPFVPGIGFSAVCYALAIFRFQLLKHPPTREPASSISNLEPGEKSSLAVFIFIFILFVSGLASSGYLAYRNYEKQFRTQVDNQLGAIASLKADELRDWRNERLADANLFYRNENFSERMQNYLETPGDAQSQAKLLTWMAKIAASPEYDRVFLIDPRGVELLSLPADPEAVPVILVEQVSASLASGQIIFLDFHRHSESDAVHLAMLVPIYDTQDNQPLGALVLRIDPNTYLYPFILRWPVPSESAETLLLRRAGEQAVYLNSLRFQPNAALDLHFPITETQIPAVRAALGETGVVEGLDYRGADVVADIRPVPDSPWFLVAKMDTAEVYAPLRERLWQMIFSFGALTLAAGAGLLLIWRQQRLRHYQTQVRTLDALRLSEEKFRLAFETSPDSVAITRARDGMFVSVNKGFEQITGYLRGEVIGKTSLEVNIWKDPQDRRNVVEALQAAGEVRNYEAPFLTLDGEIYGLMSAAIIELNDEPHILNITRDITARKQAEQKLQENKTNLSALIENTDGSIWAVDQQYQLIVGNREFHRNTSAALGRSLEMGESVLLPGFPPETNTEWQGLYDRALMGEGFTFEMSTRFRESPHYIEYHFSPIREEPDEIRGVTVFGRDITERKQAEEALHQLNDRLTLAQRLAGAGVWDWDLATGQLNWTPEFFHLFGLDPAKSDATFDTWRGALHPDDIQIAEQRINEAIREHVPLFNEYRIVTPGGETRWIGAWGDTTYNERGEALRMTGLCIDITDRKQAEKAIQESESKYRGLIQNMKVGMVVHQPDTSILLSNPMASQLLGLTADQMRGKTAIDPAWHFIREDGTPFSLEEYPVNRALSSNQPAENMVLGIVRPDLSRPIWVQCDAYQVRGVEGRLQQIVVTFFDITERKQAEEKLRESESRLRAFFRSCPLPITISRAKDGVYTDTNTAYEKLIGVHADEIIGRSAAELNVWLDIQLRAQMLRNLQTKGSVQNFEFQLKSRDGALHDMQIWAEWIELNGEPHAFAIAEDITERKRTEEALRESESLLNKIFDILPVGLWLADKNGNLTRSNEKGREIWGAEPLVGQEQYGVFKARRLPSGEELAPDDWALAHTIREGVTITDELLEIEAFDGRKKNILNYTAPVLNQDGSVDAAVIVNLDITERMRAEMALKESEERWKRAIADSPIPIMIHNEDDRVLQLSAGWTKFSGYDIDDIPTLADWTERAYGERTGSKKDYIDQLFSINQTVQNGEWIVTAKDGSKRIWDFQTTPLGKGSQGRRILHSMAIDITERKQAQEQLLHALDELKLSNDELEQFAYVASHDLQEPLRAVAGMVQLLQKRYQGQLDERADEYIRLAVDGASRMQTLIKDLLAYSRVERRGNPIKAADANVSLKYALRNLETTIAEQGAVVTSDNLPTLNADATQLTQVFQNLIGNAIKFHGERPPKIHVEARDLGEAWQFSVSDNGIGIEPQYFERIFLVFQRLHTRRDYSGTGIGLSICKKIVERHGGRIWIESTPGQGATFHFTIPNRR